MTKKLNFDVDKENNGLRLDKYLMLNTDLTRSNIQKIIENGGVLVNNSGVNKNYKCKTDDLIELIIPDDKIEILPENIPLDIVYEDDDLLVVNKPKGMVVHPANGNWSGTLVNALMYHCDDSLSTVNDDVIRPGIVHRIDKDTSGLLIVAKNNDSHMFLAEQIKEHSFSRAYEAIVYGNVKDDSGIICKPIGRNPKDRKKMAVTMINSKQAVTKYEVIQRYRDFTHIRCILETGRTHQIRVHMASIGHPVAGDSVYGPKKVITELNGQCLHAKHIGFIHPTTKKYIEFESELPEYFTKYLRKLKPLY